MKPTPDSDIANPTEVSPTTRLRLAKAAELSGLAISCLRREAARGRLVIWRVGGKDWTSLAEIDRMFELCRVEPKQPVSETTPPRSRSSRVLPFGMTEGGVAQAATLAKLKKLSSANTSRRGGPQPHENGERPGVRLKKEPQK